MSLGDRLIGGLASSGLSVLRLLDPATSSSFAGAVAASIGPLLPPSRVAHANLAATMPELGSSERRRIVRAVWRELGRTVGEFPHLGQLQENTASGPGWEIEGLPVIETLAAKGGPAIFFSAHMGNWEVLPRAAELHGVTLAGLYRAAQNSRIDVLIANLRLNATGQDTKMFAKGAPGARKAIAHLAKGGFLAILVDQKLNDGIEARFFGLPAMTAPAAATFALHFRCPVIPVLAKRVGPARLRLMVEQPLLMPATGTREGDILALTQAMNDTVERWIRADPASWLWLHRRWPYASIPAAGQRVKKLPAPIK